LVSIPSERIRRFAYLDANGDPERPAARRSQPRPAPVEIPEEESVEAPVDAFAAMPPAAPIGESAPSPAADDGQGPLAHRPGELGDEVESEAPFDLRHSSRFASRVAVLDARYPWLVPAVPMQWASLGLALFALLSLVIHSAIKVASGESPEFSRSVRLAAVYLLFGAAQFVFVPANDFAVAVTLLANPTVVLFLLCRWFGLGRASAVLALAVQLGFLVLGFGTLELVDAILASIGTAGA
jgi:hypothetical protein